MSKSPVGIFDDLKDTPKFSAGNVDDDSVVESITLMAFPSVLLNKQAMSVAFSIASLKAIFLASFIATDLFSLSNLNPLY